jgi:hypothetical protein
MRQINCDCDNIPLASLKECRGESIFAISDDE